MGDIEIGTHKRVPIDEDVDDVAEDRPNVKKAAASSSTPASASASASSTAKCCSNGVCSLTTCCISVCTLKYCKELSEREIPEKRKNGFEFPYHPFQVLTWVLFPLVVVHFFTYLYPLLWDYIEVRVILSFFFCLNSVIAMWGVYKVCSIDSGDDAITGTVTPRLAALAAAGTNFFVVSCCCCFCCCSCFGGWVKF